MVMGKQFILQLDDMAHGGDAVGRHEGKVFFVPYGVPGELVRVEITRDKGRYGHARLLEILEPSPQRVRPPCPYFGTCGGCQWQHIAYGAQLAYKQDILRTQLQRIAGLPNPVVQPTLGMADPWHYRNHMQFSVSQDGQLGLIAADRSNWVVPIEQCLIMHALLQEMFDALDIELPGLLRLSLRAGINTGEQLIIFEMEDDQPPEVEVDLPLSCVLLRSDETPVILVGSPHIHEHLAGRRYRISAPSFFQVNTQQAETLVSLSSTYLSPRPEDTILDLYCGVGTLSLGLAANAKQVIGIESSESAILDAQRNALEVDNAAFIHGLAEEVLPTLDIAGPLVVVDPPRIGVDKAALDALLSLEPPRIVYVSCDPATLARDIKALVGFGYHLHQVQPVDMFPQTYHIECVAVLEQR
jgi:23S rRNA (uracil1939-C5)-methyltransferase